MTERPEDTVLQITARYVAELVAGQQPRLSTYVASYPQYAEAIADFVLYYHTTETQASGVMVNALALSPASQSVLQRWQAEEPTVTTEVVPETLLIGVDKQHLTLPQVAEQLNLSVDIVLLLADRRIDPVTIPGVISSGLAAMTGYAMSDVKRYFATETVADNLEMPYLSKLKVAERGKYPMPAEGDANLLAFRQAVEISNALTAEQKVYWRNELKQEGL